MDFLTLWNYFWPLSVKGLLTRLFFSVTCLFVSLVVYHFGFDAISLVLIIMKTSPCNEYPLTPHFYIIKLGFTGVYISSYFCSKTLIVDTR